MEKPQKYDPAVADFIQNYTKIEVDDGWYFIPKWFQRVGDNTFIEHSFETLPQNVQDAILRKRQL